MRAKPNPVPLPNPEVANDEIPWHEARERGDVNLIIQSGRIGNNPILEQTYTRHKDFVLLRINCQSIISFKTREDLVTANWTSWVAYGAMARYITNCFYKGCKVQLMGAMRTDEFVAERGKAGPQKRRRETHVVKRIWLLQYPRKGRPVVTKDKKFQDNWGVARTYADNQYRHWVPDPTDSFATFDPEGPMPADARLPEEYKEGDEPPY